jgi:hypothetical protein
VAQAIGVWVVYVLVPRTKIEKGAVATRAPLRLAWGVDCEVHDSWLAVYVSCLVFYQFCLLDHG